MSAARKSAHGVIPGETVPQPDKVSFVKILDEEPSKEYVKHWPEHIAPPSIYADLCRERGFDPSAEADQRRRDEEFARRMRLPVDQW